MSRQVSQGKEVDTQEPRMLDQHMLDVDMLYSMVNELKSSNSTRTRIGFVTTCPPSIRPPLPWCSSAPGVQERVRNEFIGHVVPGVPVTPLDSNLHDTDAKLQGHIKVGIYGLALNPNRRKFGWLPAERQVGGKERCWPNSLGQRIQGLHPAAIYTHDMPPPPHPSGVKVVPS